MCGKQCILLYFVVYLSSFNFVSCELVLLRTCSYMSYCVQDARASSGLKRAHTSYTHSARTQSVQRSETSTRAQRFARSEYMQSAVDRTRMFSSTLYAQHSDIRCEPLMSKRYPLLSLRSTVLHCRPLRTMIYYPPNAKNSQWGQEKRASFLYSFIQSPPWGLKFIWYLVSIKVTNSKNHAPEVSSPADHSIPA